MFLTRAERRRRRRRRRFLLLLTILLVLIAWAATHGHASILTGHRPAPGPRQISRNERRPPTAAPTPSVSLRLVSYHGIQVPTSPQAGPRHQRNGLAWGFTDTPDGALLAAVNIAVRTAAQWGPAIYQPTIHNQVTGPGTDALLSADNSDYSALRAAAHVRPGQPAGRGYAAEAAYRFLAYSPADATVDIVTEGPGSGAGTVMATTQIEVVWRRSDWRVIAPPGGDWGNSATTISSLAGYTAFPNEG